MNLDDLNRFRELDTQNMCAHIDCLPDHLESAWKVGQTLPLPASFKSVKRLVVIGLGASAMAADFMAAVVAHSAPIPVFVNRGYDLPAWASDLETGVIACSHSGDTEETLCAIDQVASRGTPMLAITTGGALAMKMTQAGGALWQYEFEGESRAAVGWMLGLLLAFADRLGLATGLSEAVAESVENMRERVKILGADSPTVKNPAKRLAGQFIGRVPILYGSGILAPVARWWKIQLNENAKTVAQYEEVPEMNHNSLAGIDNPPPLMTKVAIVFLLAPRSEKYGEGRVSLRFDLCRKLFLQQGLAPDTIKARGTSALAQIMSLVQFGTYVSYYAAMAYGVDPTPTVHIDELKEGLAGAI